jgi:hypothetical protein
MIAYTLGMPASAAFDAFDRARNQHKTTIVIGPPHEMDIVEWLAEDVKGIQVERYANHLIVTHVKPLAVLEEGISPHVFNSLWR